MSEALTVSDADRQLVTAWVSGQRSPRTRMAYAHEGAELLKEVKKPLADVTIADLQAYIGAFEGFAPASIGLAVSAIKSLFAFGRLTGALSNHPATTLRSPPIKNVLAERILDEADVRRLIDGEPHPRTGRSWRSSTGQGCVEPSSAGSPGGT